MKAAWPRGLIFDLDGTLVDSTGDVADVLNAVLAEEGVFGFSGEEVRRLMGGGVRVLLEKALRARDRKASQATVDRLCGLFLRSYSKHPLRSTKPFPHTVEVFTELTKRQISIGVCTNKPEAPARLILERTGLGTHVSALVGGDTGYGLKPDPRPLQACAGRLGLRSAEVVYVGDHAVDVATARAARIPVIVVGYGYAGAAASTLGADRSIESMGALLSELAGFARSRCNPIEASGLNGRPLVSYQRQPQTRRPRLHQQVQRRRRRRRRRGPTMTT
jgi:phosphoglycolate phosphatase